MGRKRTLQQITELEYINIGELAELCMDIFGHDDKKKPKFRQSTLKFYCEIGILTFIQAGPGLNRKFKRNDAIERLKVIDELKNKKHFSIDDIVAYFKKHNSADK
jgi:DNA-binding transcriptional MerR regulator